MADKHKKKSARARVEDPAAQTVAQGETGTIGVALAEPEPALVEKTSVTEPNEAFDADLAKLLDTSSPKVERFTEEERASMGKAARSQAPLESHAEWVPSPYRLDPITLLEEQAETRVPDLVPIRYGRMMVSPFAFYRGAAYVMASDVASTPRSGLRVQACGDAHLVNFGIFASPERELLFDINDFDETAPGPWEWDVKRLAVSFEVAARNRGFSHKDRRAMVLQAVRSYREAMRQFAGKKNLEVWYAKLEVSTIVREIRKRADPKLAKDEKRQLAHARGKNNLRAFEKLTVEVEGQPRIAADPPLIVPITDLAAGTTREEMMNASRDILHVYRRTLQGDRRHLLEGYELVDVARKVVGVGSVGTRTSIGLLLGTNHQDPLFLQIKEAQDSVIAPFVGKSLFKNQGQRVVEGQRLMQAASDILLGWGRSVDLDGRNHDYYIRQLWDEKGSVDPAVMLPKGFMIYAQACGWTLARAHARSGDRIAIASYMGKSDVFDNAVADFSAAYADQNERDHAALVEAVKSGRVTAEQGV